MFIKFAEISEEMTFEELKDEYSKCAKCPSLCDSRTQVVFGSGNPNAEVIFIGEAPGANEDKQGIPFCGMSGRILSQLLSHIGLDREEIFITNTILCRPPNNRNPKKEEVTNCKERLSQLIAVMKPKVIVTIGNFATDRIIGKTGIKSIRGRIFDFEGIKVVPVVHPAALLYSGRNPEMLAQMEKDFETIASVISVKRTQKSLMDF